MDNYYENCPARMEDARFLENYKSSTSIDEFIKFDNDIVRDDEYRLFLQINADKIMDNEWLHLKKNNSCWNNACVHKYPLRMDPRLFHKERSDANALFIQKQLDNSFKCDKYVDYRMSQTPLQSFNTGVDTCNNGACPQKK
jgi:hypothetical protein